MKYIKNTFVVIPNKEFLRGKPSQLQAVYFWLCDHADENGICYPGRTLLAQESGTDIKSVDKYIKELVSSGILLKTSRKKDGTKQNLSNLYQIMILDEVAPKTVPPSPENGARGGSENGAVTIPILTQPTELPGWVKKEVWEKWEMYRKEIKKKLTPLMVKQQLIFLEQHKETHDKIIEKSIQNGWTGLFPITGTQTQGKPANVLITKNTSKYANKMVTMAAKNS